ncbi:N-formylglutamate amidohydrolase [Mesorhizobium sp. L-8-10]|uniref:N-formylglutamate amidohydrolase n=1 Tax=Mesorhizobium sp. L-8-10 TaxID=2744523 RepID=UPI001925BA0D|nr:N-formylglutamate amidohydrolase [Mesorhizobium sp. L-8-10]BCH34255.1 N-formylglutamate amidohydrolase [Mesorhizobium sp. L-8-10]
MLQSIEADIGVLSELDPEPVEVVNPDGGSRFFITCEHAGRAVPASLGDLGVSDSEMDRHIAYDVGAEGFSRRLSALLDAPLVLQRYSRLVIDCNRPLEAADCIPEVSDRTPVPANAGLGVEHRRRRFEEIHQPFHRKVAQMLDKRAASAEETILVSAHSFTPKLVGGTSRPWFVGALSNRDASFAEAFLAELGSARPDVPCAHNQPYIVDDLSDYTIPVHGEGRGLPHVLLEIRNDLISDRDGQERWATLVAAVLAAAATPRDPAHGR